MVSHGTRTAARVAVASGRGNCRVVAVIDRGRTLNGWWVDLRQRAGWAEPHNHRRERYGRGNIGTDRLVKHRLPAKVQDWIAHHGVTRSTPIR
jgi:hypothetical protein